MRTTFVLTYNKHRSPASKALWLAVALSFYLAPGANAQESKAAILAQLPWAKVNTEDLRRILDDKSAVKSFLNEIGVDGAGPSERLVSDVKEYRFVDLTGSGAVELVALVDITGRGLFNNIHIVYRRPEGLVIRELHGFGLESLDQAVTDLNRDGVYEIVLPQSVSDYAGAAKPTPVLPEVYAWTGNEYDKASSRFPAYYRDVVLPTLERKLKKLDSLPEEGMTASEKVKQRQSREKYQSEIAAVRVRLAKR
jgi:hypothetical protein